MSKKIRKIKQIELSDKELKSYISGAIKDISTDTVVLLEMYEKVRDLYGKYKSKKEIKKVIKVLDPDLSDYNCGKVINMALEFFNADNELSKSAYRNIYADRIDKMAKIVLLNMKSSKDAEIYANMIMQAAELRQLNKEDALKIPEELFDKRAIYYTDDPTKLGYEPANLQDVKKLIDSFPELSQLELEKIMADAEGFGLEQLKHSSDE